MPELAAHLERVARELIFAWQVRSNLRAPGDASTEPYEDWIISDVAAALAACAREEALEWDRTAQLHITRWVELEWRNERLAALERAVGEKGQPEAK